MGKASSAKKVARAARAGGSSNSNQRKLMFPLAVAGIVLVGVLLIVVARSGFDAVSAESPTTEEHWHQAYGFYVCDAFLPNLVDTTQDRTGIHTHGDGIIHTHPFSNAYAGSNATLGVWGETVGVDFGDTSFEVQGTTYENGHDCNGQPATVSIYRWPADSPDAQPEVITSGFSDVKLDEDRAVFTFAVVPEGTEVPRPDSVATLDNLSDVEPAPSAPPTSTLEVPVPTSDPSAAPSGAVDPSAADPAAPSTIAGETPSTTIPDTSSSSVP
jgi:hypothetical protein